MHRKSGNGAAVVELLRNRAIIGQVACALCALIGGRGFESSWREMKCLTADEVGEEVCHGKRMNVCVKVCGLLRGHFSCFTAVPLMPRGSHPDRDALKQIHSNTL